MSQAQDDLVAAASNPNAELATLHELANNYPGLRPYIAANPRTYPALLEWLGTLGDPAVDAALARRYGPAQPLTSAPADGSTQVLSGEQIGSQSPQAAPQQQSAVETQRQQPVQPEYAQPTQSIQTGQATQYQQPVQAGQPTQAVQTGQATQYQQPIQAGQATQYQQPVQTGQATQYQQPIQAGQPVQAGRPTPEGLFGIGEQAEEEAGPRPTLWLWILGAIAIVAVVALIVWFVLSNHGGGGDDTAANDDPAGNSQQNEQPKQPSQTPSESPSPSASASASQKLTAPAPPNAIEMSAFSSPSGNISCTLADDSVTCTINEHSFTPSDASCKNSSSSPVTWTVKKDGTATSSCGTSFSSTGAQLAYGSAAKNNSFACTSADNGIECWSQVSGQGFTLSREASNTKQQTGQN